MSYLVLARKYRPQTFQQVVDQEHVTRTLAHAITANRVAHAILFSGPRGTGKTTVARILAKAMNCGDGPTPAPCNECRSCREITNGSAADVFEIDGASNNSVDQVRELRENVKYMPAHSAYKIYIIDEVHMLTTAAFNALLKTLEEPPGHVMFMFATTEPHKIPITILSRCQRYDFRRIDTGAISAHMAQLCEQEEMSISEESLGLMAQEAGGSMRDALSLLDQVMACAEGTIDYPQVLDILGLVDRKMIFEMSQAALGGDIVPLLDTLDEIYSRGHDMKKLYTDLVEHFRDLLVVKMGKNVEKLVDVPRHEIDLMGRQVENIPIGHLSQIIGLFFKEEASIRYAVQPKLALEMIFIRLFQVTPALPIDALIEKLETFREGFGGKAPAPNNEPRARGGQVEKPSMVPIEKKAGPSPDIIVDDRASKGTEERVVSNSKGDPDDVWGRMTGVVSDRYPSLAANLSRCQVKAVSDERITLEVIGNGFTANMLRRNKNLAILKKIYHELFGKDIDFHITADSGKDNEREINGNHENRLKNEALSHPRVADAIEIFDGKVLDIKLL
jgi:DNA polymerase-3 subunit gamma/tau